MRGLLAALVGARDLADHVLSVHHLAEDGVLAV
jgi:hypothetical protein